MAIQTDTVVFLNYHPGECTHPACAVRPLPGKVIAVQPTPLDQSYAVRLPCGAEVLCTEALLQAA